MHSLHGQLHIAQRVDPEEFSYKPWEVTTCHALSPSHRKERPTPTIGCGHMLP
jgi:hypothetical protein